MDETNVGKKTVEQRLEAQIEQMLSYLESSHFTTTRNNEPEKAIKILQLTVMTADQFKRLKSLK